MATYEQLIAAGYTNAQAINGQSNAAGLSMDQIQAAQHGQDWRRGGEIIDQNGVMRLRTTPLSPDELARIANGTLMRPSASSFSRDLGGVGYTPPRDAPPVDAEPVVSAKVVATTGNAPPDSPQPAISTSAKVQIIVAKIKGWFARLFS